MSRNHVFWTRVNVDDLGRILLQGDIPLTVIQGAERIHQRTLPTSRQLRSFPKTMGSYSRFSDSNSCNPSIRKNLESESPCSGCQATTILSLSSPGSVCEGSSATTSPSLIKGVIDEPLTRKQLVSAGFGHHIGGVAIISSAESCPRSIWSSPFSPRVAAWTGRTGIAISFTFFEIAALFFPLPATTISKSGSLALGSSPWAFERVRVMSAVRRPARAQNHQHSGSPDKFPSCMKHCAGGS